MTQGDTIYLNELSSGTLLKTYKGHINKDYKIECSVSGDDTKVIAGSEDGCVFIWNLLSGELKKKYKMHDR